MNTRFSSSLYFITTINIINNLLIHKTDRLQNVNKTKLKKYKKPRIDNIKHKIMITGHALQNSELIFSILNVHEIATLLVPKKASIINIDFYFLATCLSLYNSYSFEDINYNFYQRNKICLRLINASSRQVVIE